MKTIKYCLRTANDELGDETIHPQRQMEKLGCKVLVYEGMTIADCVFMEIDKLPDPMPKYVEVSDFEVVVSYPKMKTLEEILDKVDISSPIIITKDFDWTTLEQEFVKSKKAACGMLQGKKIKYYEKTYKSRVMVYEMKYNEGEVFENDDLYKITNTHHDNRQTYNEIIVLMNEPNYNRCKEIRKVVESRIENLNLFTTELGMFNLIIIKK